MLPNCGAAIFPAKISRLRNLAVVTHQGGAPVAAPEMTRFLTVDLKYALSAMGPTQVTSSDPARSPIAEGPAL